MQQLLKKYNQLSFATRILLWMLIGTVSGLAFGEQVLFLKPIGEIFLQLLIMAAIPLVFFNLIAGLMSVGNIKDFGRIGYKIMIYYLITTALAIIIGIAVMSVVNAGEGMELKEQVPTNIGAMPDVGDLFRDMFPSNIFKSFADGNLVQIVVFAVLLGVAGLTLSDENRIKFKSGADFLAELTRKLVELILRASPLGLGALMASTMAEYGGQILGPLALFILAVYFGQFIMFLIYMLLLWMTKTVSLGWFLRKTSPVYTTTIATTSSLASLAVSMDISEQVLKIPKHIFSFTLPLGAQFNKDGTAIMLSAVLIFTAQAVGVDFSLSEMVQIVIVGLIVSEGSGGIPGGGLVVAMLFARAFNLPLEIVAILGGIYRLIDMGNTTINVMGDLVGTLIIAKKDAGWQQPETD
jgi:Na+/H+-dicarboxylate symporter